MAIAPHRGDLTLEQAEENRNVVHRAWRLHVDHIRHSLVNAYYQGWDLNPAQLPTRYAAVYSFFLESLDAATERLRNFIQKAGQATLVGDVFDDARHGPGTAQLLPPRHELRCHHREGSDGHRPDTRGTEEQELCEDHEGAAGAVEDSRR